MFRKKVIYLFLVLIYFSNISEIILSIKYKKITYEIETFNQL